MQTEDCSEQKEIERLIAAAIDGGDRSPVGVAKAVGRLVSEGKLSGGERLPTVRTLARVLRLSPTSVAEAWSALKRAGTIVTDGRRGTFVRDRTDRAGGGRAWRVPVESGVYEVDLSTGTPDPALLPSIGTILETLGADPVVTSYLDRPVLAELEVLLLDHWPFVPERLTVVNGALDAVDRLIASSVEMGDRVVVENPTFAPIGDLLERAGAEVMGVRLDEEGIVVEDLAAALGHRPRLLILQPRAHNPTGIGMTAERARALAGLLADTDTLVIEDDHSGAVAGADLHTLGFYLPEQVVHIHSFSKAYGPDLRLAAVGGASEPIDELIRRRQLGPSWSSRLLQAILLRLLTDPGTAELLEASAAMYSRRRRLLIDALAENGIELPGGSGFNLWLPVHDEQWALVALASRGIGVAPGSPFQIGPADGPHVRITTARVADGFEELAGHLADAAGATTHRSLPA